MASSMTAKPYDAEFYARRRQETTPSAHKVLSLIAPLVKMDRVADIGCGTGTWLATALALGATTVEGVEGDWVTREFMDDPRINLTNQSLEDPVRDLSADLVISLEVAEHLSTERADSFVEELTDIAPAVLFSAAIPGQGGVDHFNEQWQSYWAEKFIANDYLPFDIVRPEIWNDDDIPMWYRQNIILYISSSHVAALDHKPASNPKSLNIVHPLFWERANRELRYANALPESEYLKRD